MNINGTIKDSLATLIMRTHKNLLILSEKCKCPRTRALMTAEANDMERKSRKFRAASIQYELGKNGNARDILETNNPDHVEQESIDCIIANYEDLV